MRTGFNTFVFVDIDTQEDFVARDGRLSVPGAEALRPAFAELTELAKRHAIPILSSADAHTVDDAEFETFPPHCVAGTDGARKVEGTTLPAALVVPPAGADLPDAQPDQVVLQKTTFSLFSNPAADEYLARYAPRRAVVYGVATDYCVRQAVEGLLERGLEVTVVADAIAGVTEDGARRSVKEMSERGARFASIRDLEREMSTLH